ncbi:hypothetical protein AArcSl_3079 [Halalkaliarchaeum desulfuricum]|uniref:Uncharacterized protein n=2 Tax=Halalkaliarchaeum desulfuricum TaxID=2055893 RepID=A0A343TNL4_9EURY|nr:hypothetical protein AArcSl_3079 [Halalkaliarchaeum desulfuricum]
MDIVALMLLPVFAGMVLGVWSFSIDVFGGYNFAEPLWTVGGSEISIALLASVGAIAWIVGTNELDGSNYEQYEYGMIVFALLVTPAYEFIPAFGDLLASNDILAFFAWFLVAGVATWLAYTE